MEIFSALVALCAGNSPVTGEFPSQRPLTRSFGVFLDLQLNKGLSKQSKRRWFYTPSGPLWRHCNVTLFWCYSISYNNDVIYASWQLKSPTTRLFVRELVQAITKENTKAPLHSSFVNRIHRSTVDSAYKGSAVEKRFHVTGQSCYAGNCTGIGVLKIKMKLQYKYLLGVICRWSQEPIHTPVST